MMLPLLLSCVVSAAFVQGSAADRHKSVHEVLKKRAAEITATSLRDIRTIDEWERERPRLRNELLYALGLEPLPPRDPLAAKVTGRLDRTGYAVEKVVFQSLRGLYVTGNLYLPDGKEGPHPAILYVCGHSPHPIGAKVEYQDHALAFVRQGYVVLVLDTLEFGEVAGVHHGIHDLNLWNWLSMGYTPAGVEVWNAMRALDYLETRPEVDRSKFGMTGISGGGATTWFTAAVDERVAVAAPVCSTYTFGSQAAHWVAAGQCDCIYFHNTFETDFSVLGALIAPRPLLIASGRKDGDFPPDGYREVAQVAKRVYDLKGPSDRLRELDEDVGHTYTPHSRKSILEWMNRWLKGDEKQIDLPTGQDPGREPPGALACLSEVPDDAINDVIHDRFVRLAAIKEAGSLEDWKARRANVMAALKQRTFGAFPKGEIPFETKLGRGNGAWAARYSKYKEVFFQSEPGLQLKATLFRAGEDKPGTPLLIYVKRYGDSIYPLDFDELLPLLGRVDILVLNPRLTEHPVTPSEYAEIERTASWVGRTIGSMQVWDVLRALDWSLREEKRAPSSISVFGKGTMGILALYAAILDERVGEVILQDPPTSHRHGPALLNVLRITDIPEAAALLVPRRLTILGGIPEAFQSSPRLYDLSGRPDGIREAASLRVALRQPKR